MVVGQRGNNFNSLVSKMKYAARIFAVPILAKIGRAFGMSWNSLGDRLGREVILAQAPSIIADSSNKSLPQSDKPLDIVCLTMIGGHGYNTSVDIVLGLALKARGHKVRFCLLYTSPSPRDRG